jgi:peptidoglycan/LPS O-acetylase OafA/YrhL
LPPDSASSAFLLDSTLRFGDECYYGILSGPETRALLADNWVVVSGGSNAIVTAMAMANTLDAQNFYHSRDGFATGSSDIIDIVWNAAGVRTHYTSQSFAEASGGTISDSDWTAVWDERYITALQNTLGAAAYEVGDTRLTLVIGQYWDNTASVLEVVDTIPTAWQSVDVIVYTQISQWYLVCGVYSIYFCNNADLFGIGESATLRAFEDDFDSLMESAIDICTAQGTSSGRKVTCLFASNCYDAEQAGAVEPFRSALREKAAEYDAAHFLDFFGINGLKPEETIDAHATPFIHMWMWTIALNVAFDDDDVLPLTGCPEPLVASRACYAATYHDSCDGCDCDEYEAAYGTEKWECVNSRQCDFEPAEVITPSIAAAAPPTGTVSLVACGDGLDAEAIDSYSPEAETILKGCERRVWCGNEWTAWGVASATFFLALAVLLFVALQDRRSRLRAVCISQRSELPSTATVELTALESASASLEVSALPGRDLIGDGGAGSSTSPPPPPTSAHKPAERLNALNVARFLASCHIVLGHMFAKGATDNVYLFGWGFTWVPWFFMLSGYVLAHARLAAADPAATDHPIRHLAKRLAGIYPAYAVGLVVSLVARFARNAAQPNFGVLMLQTILLQTWSPTTAEQGLQMHCWFLSAMVLYWCFFGPVYRAVRKLGLKQSGVALVILAMPPWLLIFVPAFSHGGIDSNWYSAHEFGATSSSVDLWVVFLKFHPLAYAHVFVFGMVLARFRAHLRDDVADRTPQRMFLARLSCSFGASIGYIGLLVVFLTPAVRPAAAKLSARLSILMPLQGLILLGLSPLPGMWVDPVSWVFLRLPQYLGDISYPQYVLQMVVYEFFPMETLSPTALIPFFLVLLSASSLLQELVARPGRVWWTRHARAVSPGLVLHKDNMKLFIPPGLVALVFILSALIYSPTPLAPQVVVVEENAAVDVLHLWNPGAGLKDTTLINPSLLLFRPKYDATAFPHLYPEPADPTQVAPMRLVRAARAHAMSTRREETSFSKPVGTSERKVIGTEITSTWTSHLVFDETNAASVEDWASWDVARWGLDGGGKNLQKTRLVSDLGRAKPWNDLCEPVPTYIPENKTLFRKVVRGPEDPKLIALPPRSVHGPYAVAFSSYPPKWTRKRCDQTYDAVQQMFFAADGLSLARHDRDTPGVRLDCGYTRRDEKNWVAFTYNDQLHFVYSLHPHTIVSARALDGACEERWSTSGFKLFADLAMVPGFKTRGSATAVHYRDGAYLALMHTADADGLYATFAYTFSDAPPFGVLAVSRPLPLQRSERAFASGLMYVPEAGKIVVSYGVDNAEARSLVMSVEFLEGLFEDRCLVVGSG